MDDQFICCEALPPGARLVNGKVSVVESEAEADIGIPSDIRSSKILMEIANSILTFIQLTSDCPASNPSGFMPLLDLKVKVKENKIIHVF